MRELWENEIDAIRKKPIVGMRAGWPGQLGWPGRPTDGVYVGNVQGD